MNRRVFQLLTVLAGIALVAFGCANQASSTRTSEALYLSLEVQEHGRTVARPKVLGFEGKNIMVEKRSPRSSSSDYRLVVLPSEEGDGYGVKLDLELPSGRRSAELGLLHGEERRVLLDPTTELKVMLMRVDSPEFRALIMDRRHFVPSTI